MNYFKSNRDQLNYVASLLVIMVLVVACSTVVTTPLPSEVGVTPFATQTGTTSQPTGTYTIPLSEAMLKNAAYQGIYTQTVQLTDGTYTGPPSVEGAASRPTINFTGVYAFGDLSADGAEDAAVILVENSGGTGSFIYLAAVLNQQGKPVNVSTLLLGDRIQVQSMTIDGGQIIVQLKQQGPNDPLCCPTQEVENTYGLQGNRLILATSKILG